MKSLRDESARRALRIALRDVALNEVGQVESPPRSNRTKYGKWYGLDGAQWCAMFVSWVYAHAAERAGVPNPLVGLQTAKGFQHCSTSFPKAKAWGIVLGKDEPLMVGDVLIWTKGPLQRLLPLGWVGLKGHTGVVVHVHADGSFDVVEGNTNGSYSRTGGEVRRHSKHRRDDGSHGTLRAVYRPTRRFYKPTGG